MKRLYYKNGRDEEKIFLGMVTKEDEVQAPGVYGCLIERLSRLHIYPKGGVFTSRVEKDGVLEIMIDGVVKAVLE